MYFGYPGDAFHHSPVLVQNSCWVVLPWLDTQRPTSIPGVLWTTPRVSVSISLDSRSRDRCFQDHPLEGHWGCAITQEAQVPWPRAGGPPLRDRKLYILDLPGSKLPRHVRGDMAPQSIGTSTISTSEVRKIAVEAKRLPCSSEQKSGEMHLAVGGNVGCRGPFRRSKPAIEEEHHCHFRSLETASGLPLGQMATTWPMQCPAFTGTP